MNPAVERRAPGSSSASRRPRQPSSALSANAGAVQRTAKAVLDGSPAEPLSRATYLRYALADSRPPGPPHAPPRCNPPFRRGRDHCSSPQRNAWPPDAESSSRSRPWPSFARNWAFGSEVLGDAPLHGAQTRTDRRPGGRRPKLTLMPSAPTVAAGLFALWGPVNSPAKSVKRGSGADQSEGGSTSDALCVHGAQGSRVN